MLTLSLPLETNPDKAVMRAINRVMVEKPEIRAVAIEQALDSGTFLVSAKSQPAPYRVTLTLNPDKSQLDAVCECLAHKGEDTIIDHDGNALPLVPQSHKPQLCKHIMAVLLSLTHQGETAMAWAQCNQCATPHNTSYFYVMGWYLCPDCMQDDLFGNEYTVPVCEACCESPASPEGALCYACYAALRHLDRIAL